MIKSMTSPAVVAEQVGVSWDPVRRSSAAERRRLRVPVSSTRRRHASRSTSSCFVERSLEPSCSDREHGPCRAPLECAFRQSRAIGTARRAAPVIAAAQSARARLAWNGADTLRSSSLRRRKRKMWRPGLVWRICRARSRLFCAQRGSRLWHKFCLPADGSRTAPDRITPSRASKEARAIRSVQHHRTPPRFTLR